MPFIWFLSGSRAMLIGERKPQLRLTALQSSFEGDPRNRRKVPADAGHFLEAWPLARLSFLLPDMFEPGQSADATVPPAQAIAHSPSAR